MKNIGAIITIFIILNRQLPAQNIDSIRLNDLGLEEYSHGNIDNGLKYFSAAVEKDKSYAMAHYNFRNILL
jgi:hypothetical protein